MSARRVNKGEIYIGLIIALAILVILSQAIMSLVFSAYDLLNFTQARTTAKHIASEQIELIRNLPYDDVATVGGIPPGNIPQTQDVVRNGLNYQVDTSIVYVDDPFDGTQGGNPDDILATDYKLVRVEVSWEGLAASRGNPVVLVTNLSPKGVETVTGGGTLSILIFDANSQPVSGADVQIIGSGVNVNITQQTGANGRLIFPGAPVCNACYQLTVSKTGYNSERTYSITEVANPSKPHLTVLEGQLTQTSFNIDRLSTLNISSTSDRANNFSALPSQSFSLRGDKIIGKDGNDYPVYKYNETLTTDASGSLILNDMEWDNYTSTFLNPSYDLAGTNPLNPFVLNPNTTLDFKFALSSNSINSLLVRFKDAADNPIASVSALLKDSVNPVASASSGLSVDPDFGQVFFPNLQAKTYTLEATASGYQNYSSDVAVSGNSSENVTLSP
ncbi:MAG: hypothetical protein US96_C0053G0004 [Candidatus Woesebacteria bacterium GW2011_GWB1_38_5b]|uniref:Carboxypeptidase regulatory-like domain-containing protein n=1 Tax=Candidatus Woesebacteria bacterium GW2011_GWB1_38_5b TaxID=1618569 RepID=A0A0G0K230_9BACT|nr:MAG: hypothetical protein US96_C0053G0004 [Candidatus Woesebacteria bacterium GW2011_GWB1_38_5b]